MKKYNSKYNSYNYYSPVKPRKGVPNKRSKYPKWMNKIPYFQKFMKLSRKRKILLGAWVAFSIIMVITLFTTVMFANALGSRESIMNRNKTGLTLTDKNDEVFYQFYNARSETFVPISKISPEVKDALIASEDKDFYKHHGFSPLGIGNAVWQNIRPGGLDNGGSTITQQLVASALLTKDRTLMRKYQELVLSVEIERRYSKDEILEMYLNSVYFGEGAFGIEDAARTYFNKSAKDLNTAESAMLIGLLPAPSAYSPLNGDPKKAEIRQDYVLNRMVEEGKLTEAEAKKADDKKLAFAEAEDTQYEAPHFALMVLEELEKKYGGGDKGEEYVARSGFKVKTTLDLDLQRKAEKAVENQVALLAGSNVSNGGAVVIDPKTGEIRALVGSADWENDEWGKLNITTANRQPGSSFKPFVYGTGIENEVLTAATIFKDKLTDFGGYTPYNYDRRFRGDVTLRRALANSLNVPAVSAMQQTGVDQVIDQTRKLGLTTLSDDVNYGLPLALGSGEAKLTEMTNAYAVFANQGRHNEITTYTSITDKENKQIFKYEPKNERAISDQTSYILSSILSDNAARAETFGSSLTISRPAAVKTGTTENYRDAWTLGYTPSIAVGVWIGNNNGELMSSVAGSSGAAPIWRNIMEAGLANTPYEQFTAPSGIATRDICRSNGGVAEKAGTNTYKEFFKAGALPDLTCEAKEKKKEEPKKKEEEPKVEETPIEETPPPEEPDPETPPVETPPTEDPPVTTQGVNMPGGRSQGNGNV